jgi:hypothetical protein
LRQLGVKDDADFVNPHGGAIALGHPLGMSGAWLASDGARHGEAGGKRALATMCRRRAGRRDGDREVELSSVTARSGKSNPLAASVPDRFTEPVTGRALARPVGLQCWRQPPSRSEP